MSSIIRQTRELSLTPGAIEKLLNGQENMSIVVKLLEVFLNLAISPKEKIVGIISDGKTKIKCYFSSRYRQEFEEKIVYQGALIRIENVKQVYIPDGQKSLYVKEIAEILEKKEGKEKNAKEMYGQKRKEESVEVRKESRKDLETVKDISPFVAGAGWKIRVKVVTKSPLKEYNTDGREGKIFRVNLMDKTGTISMIFFNEHANNFYSKVEVNKTYQISGGQIKVARKMYNTEPVHTYEIFADRNTEIMPIDCEREIIQVPNLTKIAVAKENINMVANLLVVLIQVNDPVVILRKSDGSPLDKRNIVVADDSRESIEIVLWSEMAKATYTVGDIILLQNAWISEFQSQPQITIRNTTIISVNPEIPEAFKLGGWYKQNREKIQIDDRDRSFVASSQTKKIEPSVAVSMLNDVKAEAMEHATIKCTVIGISDKLFYTSCSKQGCKKKVVQDESTNQYFCSKCNTSYDTCKYSYYVIVHLSDKTDQLWVSLFHNGGTTLFGMQPEKMNELLETDEEEYRRIKHSPIGKEAYFVIYGKRQEYKGEPEMKYVADSIQFLDYKEESAFILSQLD